MFTRVGVLILILVTIININNIVVVVGTVVCGMQVIYNALLVGRYIVFKYIITIVMYEV
jgi:hypothetical protein